MSRDSSFDCAFCKYLSGEIAAMWDAMVLKLTENPQSEKSLRFFVSSQFMERAIEHLPGLRPVQPNTEMHIFDIPVRIVNVEGWILGLDTDPWIAQAEELERLGAKKGDIYGRSHAR